MNIAALMNVTVANGYTAAEEANAQRKLEKFSAYEKAEAVETAVKTKAVAPQQSDSFVYWCRDDSVMFIILAVAINCALFLIGRTKPQLSEHTPFSTGYICQSVVFE